MSLKGGREIRRRLKAIKTVFKPAGRDWADETVRLARSRVKVRTGKTRNTIRRKNASQKKAAVEARGGARFLEAGTQAHTIKPRKAKVIRFTKGGGPIFTKKVQHRGMRKQPFLHRSARDALGKVDILGDLVDLWNKAA